MDKQEEAMKADEKELLENLCLADDLGFGLAFDDNPEGTEFLVRTILSRQDITVEKAKTDMDKMTGKSPFVVVEADAHDGNGNPLRINIIRPKNNDAYMDAVMKAFAEMLKEEKG